MMSQLNPEGSEPILPEVTWRGRLIAQLDLASWLATDALYATSPDRGRLGYYVAFRDKDSCRVAFGRLSSDGTTFALAYEAFENPAQSGKFELKKFEPPRIERAWLPSAARAIAFAMRAFPRHPDVRNYNPVVVPKGPDENSVYLYPGSTDPQIEVLGADGVVDVRDDGQIGVTQYHKSLMTQPRDSSDSWEGHTHHLIDEPCPMDVAYVLMRRPPSPSMITAQGGTYLIWTDGAIHRLPASRETDGSAPS